MSEQTDREKLEKQFQELLEAESTFSLEQAQRETRRSIRCDRNSVQEWFLRGPNDGRASRR